MRRNPALTFIIPVLALKKCPSTVSNELSLEGTFRSGPNAQQHLYATVGEYEFLISTESPLVTVEPSHFKIFLFRPLVFLVLCIKQQDLP